MAASGGQSYSEGALALSGAIVAKGGRNGVAKRNWGGGPKSDFEGFFLGVQNSDFVQNKKNTHSGASKNMI